MVCCLLHFTSWYRQIGQTGFSSFIVKTYFVSSFGAHIFRCPSLVDDNGRCVRQNGTIGGDGKIARECNCDGNGELVEVKFSHGDVL